MTVTGAGIKPFELSAGELRLRPWRPADAAVLLRAFGDPLIALWQPGREVADLATARGYAAALGDWSAGSHVSFAVTAATGQVLGSVSLHQIDRIQRDAEIGYWTLPEARGHGFAVQAVGMVTRWGFDELGMERIELRHAVGNTASCRVSVKAGYPLEGTLRRAYRYGDGERHDEHLHARLVTDP